MKRRTDWSPNMRRPDGDLEVRCLKPGIKAYFAVIEAIERKLSERP
jgi:hypothetical protein